MAELAIRVQSFLNLLTQGVRLVGCSSTSIRASSCSGVAAPITSHNQFALSQAHGACDQPLQNLLRIHYHVSGCSTSRDHVPILYDILYWGGGRGSGSGARVRDVVRSFTEAEVRGRTCGLLRSESPLQGAGLGSLCLGAQWLVWTSGEEPGRFEFHIHISAVSLVCRQPRFHSKHFVLVVFTVLLK